MAINNLLTAGPEYIRFFIFYYHIKNHHILYMLKIKCDNKSARLSNLNNFHSLEVVDRVSETHLQVSEIPIE